MLFPEVNSDVLKCFASQSPEIFSLLLDKLKSQIFMFEKLKPSIAFL